MYKNYEGNRDQFVKERNSLITMAVSCILLGIFMWSTIKYSRFSNTYYALYVAWFVISVIVSKVYMFFKPRRRFGTVKAIKNFRQTQIRAHGGACGTATTYAAAEVTEVTLGIDFDNGSYGEFVFVYKGDLKILEIGDRVGIYRFLRMPVWENSTR